MKKIGGLLFVIIAAIALPSCEKVIGEGPVVTENRGASPFSKLAVSVPADTYFTQSATYSLEIDAQQNILDEIETVVINNELKIRFRHPNINIRNCAGIVVRVSAPEITNADVSGSGNLTIEQPDAPATLKLVVSGSGKINADKSSVSYFEAFISGSGNITVNSGTANEEKISISGSGFVNAENVMVKEADTHISGSGTMRVFATEKLKAHISGSGTVFYKGTPAITSTVSGSGSVVKL